MNHKFLDNNSFEVQVSSVCVCVYVCLKGVIWCNFNFSFSLVCYVAAYIRSAGFYLKEKAYPDQAKSAHLNMPPHVYVMMWKYLRNAA